MGVGADDTERMHDLVLKGINQGRVNSTRRSAVWKEGMVLGAESKA